MEILTMPNSPMKGMSLQELLAEINCSRRSAGLERVTLNTRPSSDGRGTTIEVLTESGTLLTKSSHGGAINWFLKGMVTGFTNRPAPTVSRFNVEIGEFKRAIDWKEAV
jgi:hypothetical protein